MGIDPGIQRAIDAQKAKEPPFNTDDAKLKRFLDAANIEDISHPDITVHEDLCVRTPGQPGPRPPPPPGWASRGASRPPRRPPLGRPSRGLLLEDPHDGEPRQRGPRLLLLPQLL